MCDFWLNWIGDRHRWEYGLPWKPFWWIRASSLFCSLTFRQSGNGQPIRSSPGRCILTHDTDKVKLLCFQILFLFILFLLILQILLVLCNSLIPLNPIFQFLLIKRSTTVLLFRHQTCAASKWDRKTLHSKNSHMEWVVLAFFKFYTDWIQTRLSNESLSSC